MSIRQYSNNAPPQALTSLLAASSGATTVAVASTTGYPTPPFILGLDRGTSSQEVCLCTAIASGTTFTVQRGYDGTSPVLHNIGATVEHTSAALDYREPNAFINLMTTLGDIIVYGPSGPTRLGIGSNNQVLVADNTQTNGLAWKAVPAITKTIRIPLTYSFSGLLAVPSGSLSFLPPTFFPVPGTQTASFAGVRAKIRGGTSVTLGIQQNGSNISGLGSIVVTPTAATTLAGTPPAIAEGDTFAPVIASITGSPDGLSLTFYIDVTV